MKKIAIRWPGICGGRPQNGEVTALASPPSLVNSMIWKNQNLSCSLPALQNGNKLREDMKVGFTKAGALNCLLDQFAFTGQ